MPMNTPYLSDQTTDFTSDVSMSSALTVGGAVTIIGAATMAGAASITGVITATAGVVSSSTLDNTAGVFLSRLTTASANSATLADGELAILESTNTNVTLGFRSGNTTYHWVSSNGSVG